MTASLIVGASVQVLVTLMYIYYSDLLSISLLAFTPVYIHFNCINSYDKLLVWFTDCNVIYGKNPYHIVLLCLNIAVLSLFIVPFTFIGLFGIKMLRSLLLPNTFVHLLMLFMNLIKTIYDTNLVYS